ncbi:MAG: secreted protein [Blastococcus sp.]|nr:secreted protein [Blastococcus sp.]
MAGTAGCAGDASSESSSEPTNAASADTTPEPPAEPTADVLVPLSPSTPVRLRIPAIGVDSALMGLGLQGDGSLEVPPEGFPAGWYTGAPTPGALGPAIIAGHVDWDGSPGVFFSLRDLAPGDTITVEREDGTAARFRVDSVQQFAKDAFPTDAVYADIDHAGLRLITCGGSFDRDARSYRDNIVVFADLAGVDQL